MGRSKSSVEIWTLSRGADFHSKQVLLSDLDTLFTLVALVTPGGESGRPFSASESVNDMTEGASAYPVCKSGSSTCVYPGHACVKLFPHKTRF